MKKMQPILPTTNLFAMSETDFRPINKVNVWQPPILSSAVCAFYQSLKNSFCALKWKKNTSFSWHPLIKEKDWHQKTFFGLNFLITISEQTSNF